MVHILEVTPDDINKLDEKQLPDLLLRLLRMEAQKYEIPKSCISGSLNIKASDGGEDAHIKWIGGPDKTEWLPNRYTLFQCKATEMPPSKCKDEIVNKGELKPRVKDVFDNGGSYVLFCTDDFTVYPSELTRVEAFREAIKNTGAYYYKTVDIKIYDSNKISRWVNEYVSAIVQVCSWLGRPLPNIMNTWEDWKKYPENDVKYVQDDTLSGHISQLKNHFIGAKKVARIVGLSGLGKTRLAFEVFRPPENSQENLEAQMITDQVVYIDAADDSTGLQGIIKQWRDQKLESILVVDNCELELHQRLRREIEHPDSRLSLLTLDYDPESCDDCNFIKLKPASEEVIKGILKQSYPGLQDLDINRILEFAEGFPKIAVILAKALRDNVHDIGNLNDNTLMEKLLWGRGPQNDDARKVISACSLFTHLGFSDDMIHQSNFVAEKICNISKDEFYEHAVKFIDHGILDRRNRFVRVVPIPLAVRLAADWWKRCHPEKAKELITGDMPDGMSEALCDQISKLHHVHEARQLTKELCGDTGPFGQAEVLNSGKGSRLFRSLVEVNPIDTVNALEHAFSGWDKEQLLQVKAGRRNLVWSLQKLCFWEETFPISARILLSFAVAENETWGNNATNIFFQLFHYLLSGTQAPPNLRLNVLDEALATDEIEYKRLAVEALGHALLTHHFSRDCNAEIQGSRAPQEDWKPKVWQDVFDYWAECFNRLIPLAIIDDELGALARKQIADHLRGQVQYGRMEVLESALKSICVENDIFWPEAYKEIKNTIYFDGAKLPSDGLKKLKFWVEILAPRTFIQRWKLIISEPHHEFEIGEGETYSNRSYRLASEFAEECSKNTQELFENLKIVFEGNQARGYEFGHALGKYLDQEDFFIKEALSVLKKIKSDRANPSVLCGFISSISPKNPQLIEEMLDSVVNDDDLYIHTIKLTCSIKSQKKDLDRIIKLVKIGKFNINDLRAFAYGGSLKHLSPEDVISFCEDIISFGNEGIPPALEVLFMYTFQDDEKFKLCLDEIQKILEIPDILFEFESASNMDAHHFIEFVTKLLNEERNDEFAINISKVIIGDFSSEKFIVGLIYSLKPVLRILLSKYRDVTWPIFGDALLSDYRISYLFMPDNNAKYYSEGVLSELSEDFLIRWCNDNPKIAPVIIAKLVPLFIKEDETYSFHPIAKSLIYTFGDRPDVQSAIDSNMWSFSSVGSSTPYYEKQIEAIKKLETDKNPKLGLWCTKIIKRLNERIEYEKGREEEEKIGII
ncbi:MAG: hypothetical protein O8C62_00715 [Candidatus Methanoperedens sp.]|nr:hypothetical protein [Candidatus Methanoperedens sp.]